MYILRGHSLTGYNFQKCIVFLSLEFDYVLANSADPNEMPNSVAFYLDFCCLQKCQLRGFKSTKNKVLNDAFGLLNKSAIKGRGLYCLFGKLQLSC